MCCIVTDRVRGRLEGEGNERGGEAAESLIEAAVMHRNSDCGFLRVLPAFQVVKQ